VKSIQIIEVRERESGEKYWHSAAPGWVQHDTLEIRAESFAVGSTVTVVETEELTSAVEY